MEIKRSGSQPSGSVRVDPLFQANESTRASAASVTSGYGRVQSWGGPIEEIPPGDVV
jgi:hypothetical protein